MDILLGDAGRRVRRGRLLFFTVTSKPMEFFTAYLIEYSLSIDNLFVFMLIFRFFDVPHAYEHKALFWGISARADHARRLYFCGCRADQPV